jgi:putative redox protein
MRRQSIMATTNEKLEFPNGRGQVLAGRLDRPQGQPKAYALFAHCFTCSKDTVAAARIAAALAARGIATLRFDFTGLGGSGGDFANTNFSSNVEDLLAAAAWLETHRGPARLLIGHSLGGAAMLAAAARLPEAKAVATIGAPADPSHVTQLLADQAADIEADGEAEVELAGRRFRIRKQFLDDLAGQEQGARLARLGKALLVMHAPLDDIVGIDNASRIFLAAKHPKSFVSLDDANHLLTRRRDAEYAAGVIAAWAQRYIGGEETMPGWPRAAEDEVVVEETRLNPFQQAISAGPHRLIADEPESYGGGGTGPSPYDLLTAGLGACTAMTVRMYADRKGLPLEKVRVSLRHDKIHAEDCADCETKVGKVDRIQRVIRLSGPLDAEAKAKLLEIADKCPVHRTLHAEIKIVTELAE